MKTNFFEIKTNKGFTFSAYCYEVNGILKINCLKNSTKFGHVSCFISDNVCLINNIEILKQYQDFGVGSQLLKLIEFISRKNKILEINCVVNYNRYNYLTITRLFKGRNVNVNSLNDINFFPYDSKIEKNLCYFSKRLTSSNNNKPNIVHIKKIKINETGEIN